MMQGKIALEEHFILPSFGAYGADASALDGTTKVHNYDPRYFADVQKRLGNATLRVEDMDRCGIERVGPCLWVEEGKRPSIGHP